MFGEGTIVCCTSNYSLSSQRLQFVFRRGIRALCHRVIPTSRRPLPSLTGGVGGGSVPFDTAKVRHSHCGSRMFWQLFFEKVLKSLTFLFLDFTLLQCCSVAVLLRVFPCSKNTSISIYLYIYKYIDIDLNFDFRRIYFGTATLQHCNNS